jgi:hypothetical protein
LPVAWNTPPSSMGLTERGARLLADLGICVHARYAAGLPTSK